MITLQIYEIAYKSSGCRHVMGAVAYRLPPRQTECWHFGYWNKARWGNAFWKELFAPLITVILISKAPNLSRVMATGTNTIYIVSGKNGSSDTGYKKAVMNFVTDRNVSDCYKEVEKVFHHRRWMNWSPNSTIAWSGSTITSQKRLPEKLITLCKRLELRICLCWGKYDGGARYVPGDTSRFYGMLRYPITWRAKWTANIYYLILPEADAYRIWQQRSEWNAAGSHYFYGKIYYAVKALLPEAADSVVMGYTDPQMDYCKRYEKPVGLFCRKEQALRYQSGCAEGAYQRGTIHGRYQ